ncbi:MAG TPA: CvpA family protein [Rhizomicrobium sp.]|jgi:membrane protein required for colicin V production
MHELNISFVDLIVVGVVIASTILAVYRGFVRETLSIFAWAAAAFATIYFGPALAHLLRDRIATPIVGTLIGYAGVFLVVLIPLSFISYRFSEGVRNSPVGALDRSLGVAFGALRGMALIGIAYLAFCLVVPVRAQPAWLTGARTMPVIRGSSDVLLSLVPDGDRLSLSGGQTVDASASRSGVPVPKPAPRRLAAAHRHGQKTYGADERRALDHLIEATGSGGDAKR